MLKNNYSVKKSFFSETAHIVRDAISERCKFNIHGHSYQWNATLYTDKLQENGMVLDFKELGFIKQLVDLFDHTTVLWMSEKQSIIDFFNGNFKRVIIMRKNPTAENMTEFLTNIIINYVRNNEYLKGIVKAIKVEVYETKYNSAIYEIDDIDVATLEYDDVTFFGSDEIVNDYNSFMKDENCILIGSN